MPKNSTCAKLADPNNINNTPISYGSNTITQPSQLIFIFLFI
nr:MAG TPA: hypothetical protein [Caudoviricetes sp.]